MVYRRTVKTAARMYRQIKLSRFFSFLLLFLFVSCNNTKQTKSESKKYNIVFILADDMGRNYVEGRPGDPGSQGFDDVLNTGKPKETDGPAKDAHKWALLTERTLAFLDKNKDKPFFAYVSFNAVHRH